MQKKLEDVGARVQISIHGREQKRFDVPFQPILLVLHLCTFCQRISICMHFENVLCNLLQPKEIS